MNDEQKKILSSPQSYEKSPIIFFDAECLLCDGFVNLLLKIDKKHSFRLAPLQGETARQLLPKLPNNPEQWSIFYLDKNGIYQQSDAFIQICRNLGGAWCFFSLTRIIPRPIRDYIYRIVARNRYRWFGRKITCRLLKEDEKELFLP